MRIQELTEYLDTYLRAGEFHDYAPNGLQVEGTREVKHIVLGVSASLGLIDEAARLAPMLCWYTTVGFGRVSHHELLVLRVVESDI